MCAIHRRFKASGLEDLLVSVGVIAEGSVELKGKHYKLIQNWIRCGKDHGIIPPEPISYLTEMVDNVKLDSVNRLLSFVMLIEQFNRIKVLSTTC